MVAERDLCLYGVYKFTEKHGLRCHKTMHYIVPKGTNQCNLVPKATNINSIEGKRHKIFSWSWEIREKFWKLNGKQKEYPCIRIFIDGGGKKDVF